MTSSAVRSSTESTAFCLCLGRKEKDAVELRQRRQRPKGDDERDSCWTFWRTLFEQDAQQKRPWKTWINLLRRLQNSSGWPPAGQHKNCPALFKWLLHTQEERRRDKGKQWEEKKERDRWESVLFWQEAPDGACFFECLLWVKGPLAALDCAHLLCTVKFEKRRQVAT